MLSNLVSKFACTDAFLLAFPFSSHILPLHVVEPTHSARCICLPQQLVASLEKLAATDPDPDMQSLAAQELESASLELNSVQNVLKAILLPDDEHDVGNALVEIKAGIGGQESALFVGELLKMYIRLAQRKRWKTELMESTSMSSSYQSKEAYRDVLLQVEGQGAYQRFKQEIGVHRVQRVPSTESAGRTHTSTVGIIVCCFDQTFLKACPILF